MARKKPCKICGHWFKPNPRAGSRQKTCNNRDCQRECHRRACAFWHRKNPGYDTEARLRKRFQKAQTGAVETSHLNQQVSDFISFSAMRDVVELEVVVALEVTSQVVSKLIRDAVMSQLVKRKRVKRKVPQKARETPLQAPQLSLKL